MRHFIKDNIEIFIVVLVVIFIFAMTISTCYSLRGIDSWPVKWSGK